MPDLTPLRRPTPPIRHPADVARLRAALEAAGYTASDEDIRWAWEQFSEENWAAGWIPLESVGPDRRTVRYLRDYLVEESDHA
jgi:hypothetical protein